MGEAETTSAAIDPTVSERDIEQLIATLLDDPPPADRHDQAAIAVHTQILEATAVMAGVSMLEALVRHAAAEGSVYLSEVNTAGDALLGLHRGLISYQRKTLRRDGLERAWSTMEHATGVGIAACTMGALERLRAGLGGLMREHWIRCDGPPRRD